MRPGKRKPCKNKRAHGHVFARKLRQDAIYIPSFLVNEGSILLHHIIYSSKATGATGMTTLSLAQILGESEANNRRDHITSCLMFHQGQFLQLMEGARSDLDRLVRRLQADPRHTGMKFLVDSPIHARRLDAPMALLTDADDMLRRLGLASLSSITAPEAMALLQMHEPA